MAFHWQHPPLGWHHLWDRITSAISAATASAQQGLSQGYHHLGQATSQVLTAAVTASTWLVPLYVLLVLVMVVGIAGAFIPGLPGATLILGMVVVWGLIKGFTGLWVALGAAIAAFVLGMAVDYLAGIIGAQRVGASSWGQIGAIVGMMLGLLGLLPTLPVGGPLLGMVLGTMTGAFGGEFLYRRELPLTQRAKQATKVGFAIVLGSLVGNILQGFLALLAVGVFVFTTWPSVF